MSSVKTLHPNQIYHGDARKHMWRIDLESITLSVWSPPYHVGKSYEGGMTFAEWQSLLKDVIQMHVAVLIPGGFMAINIADILCFRDATMPRIMAENVNRRRCSVTHEQVLNAKRKHPHYNRNQLAELLGCSEQTIDRRLNGNNIRGGKYESQTRVKIVGGMLEKFSIEAGLYLYDRRVWMKDAAWENSKWHTISYRSVDEFEYIYVFWKPGITTVDRSRLSRKEWVHWGSRGVWHIPSVRANDNHEAKFPIELPRRLVQMLTSINDIVLDPFIGSGSSAIAAFLEKRRYIGIDKEEKYVKVSRYSLKRVRLESSSNKRKVAG